MLIVIDPAHGGERSGYVATTGNREKDANLALSLALLKRMAMPIQLTRYDDTHAPNAFRHKLLSEADIAIQIAYGGSTQFGAIDICYSIDAPASTLCLARRIKLELSMAIGDGPIRRLPKGRLDLFKRAPGALVVSPGSLALGYDHSPARIELAALALACAISAHSLTIPSAVAHTSLAGA